MEAEAKDDKTVVRGRRTGTRSPTCSTPSPPSASSPKLCSSRPGSTARSTRRVIVACANGLLDVDTRDAAAAQPEVLQPDRGAVRLRLRTPSSRRAGCEFLDELWPDDPDSIAALQEFFGYVISGRVDLQKILLLVGPTRGGKGAIARVLGELVGPRERRRPDAVQLGNDFGLAPLLGKPLAVISDARLDGRNTPPSSNGCSAISGEDTITVNRKYRDQWTGKLPSRFMVISNELPHFGDAAGAIVGRFVVLLLTRSWLGAEDPDLEPALHAELPEILTWALDGLDRLREQGRFTKPPSSDEAIIALWTSPPRSPRSSATAAPGPRRRGRRAATCSRVEDLGRGQRPQARHLTDASAGTCAPPSRAFGSCAPAATATRERRYRGITLKGQRR